jgi:AcrR family transcriptional regulator
MADGLRRKRVPSAAQGGIILKAAGDLFLARGYAGVSIDAIVAAVGGSKREIYAQFGDKESLFREVIVALCQENLRPFQALAKADDLEFALASMATAFLGFLLSPRTLALHRLVIAEAPRFPEIAKDFLRQGPLRAYGVAADLLRTHAQAGEVRVDDPDAAARVFLDALTGDFQLRSLAGRRVSREEIDKRVRLAVRIFAKGIAT